MMAWRYAPLLPFALSNRRHPGKHDGRHATPDAARNFRLAGVSFVEELFDTLSRARVDTKIRGRGPMAAADHVGGVAAQHFSAERARVQRLLCGLVLRRMRSGKRNGQVPARDQVVEFLIEVI